MDTRTSVTDGFTSAPTVGRVRARRFGARVAATDRAVLGYWLAAHVALLVLAYAAAWVEASGNAHERLTGGYQQWDANLLQSIAQYGYWGGPDGSLAHPHQEAFFPGYPLLLAAVHLVVRNWVAAELLLSLLAGAVALVALGRLAGDRRAALFMVTAPAAVFLTVGYSEGLFLAFAVPAWLAARDRRWWLAGGLGYFAAFTRPSGLFLIPALLLATVLSGPGRWKSAAKVLPCVVAPVVYEMFLYMHTHRWSAWLDANRDGWGVKLTSPWAMARTSYGMAFGHGMGAGYGFMSQLELAALAAMLAGTVALLILRRWPEALYVGLTFVSLMVAGYAQACDRATLACFPLYVLLAKAAARWRWAGGAYLATSAPLAAVVAVMYLSGQWAG